MFAVGIEGEVIVGFLAWLPRVKLTVTCLSFAVLANISLRSYTGGGDLFWSL